MTDVSNDKYIEKYVKDHAKLVKVLEKFVKQITPPEGFTAAWVDDAFFMGGNHKTKNFVLTNEDAKIKFTFKPGGSGTTSFFVEGRGWLTFDRRGVEDSFYFLPFWEGDVRPTVLEMITEHLARIEERRKYYLEAITIPQIGHTVSQEGLAKMKATFKKNGITASQSFHPSGFGTGYIVSRQPSRYGSKRAIKALEDLIGVAPLYISTFDAD